MFVQAENIAPFQGCPESQQYEAVLPLSTASDGHSCFSTSLGGRGRKKEMGGSKINRNL